MSEFKIVGVSVSKDTLNVCFYGRRMAFIRNSPGGLETLLNAVLPMTPDLVAIEQCDGLEQPVAEAFAASGITTDVLASREVTDFARVTGRFANSGGRTDARTVYACATRRRVERQATAA